jgi:hypothetical protein
MLAFVDLIHALPTKGEESTQIMFPGGSFASREEKLGEMYLGALFRLNFSCPLVPMVSSPFALP